MSKPQIFAVACACAAVLAVLAAGPLWAGGTWTVYTAEGSREEPVPEFTMIEVGEPEVIDYGEGVMTGTGQGTIISVDEEVIPGPGGTPAVGPAAYSSGWGGPEDGVTQDRHGNLWFVRRRGASRFDGSTWTNYTAEDGLPETASDVAVDLEGNVWFSGFHKDGNCKGVSRFDGQSWTRFNIEATDVTVAPNGDVWLCGQGEGAYRFDGSSWWHYTAEDGLGYPYATVVQCNGEGDVWFGLSAFGDSRLPELPTPFGVTMFNGTTWVSYGYEYENVPSGATEGLHQITSMLVDRDNALWAGTEDGLLSFDSENWRRYPPQNNVAMYDIRDLTAGPSGSLWVVSVCGLAVRKEDSWYHVSYEDLGEGCPVSLFFDTAGTAWILTYSGQVIRWDHPTAVAVETSEAETPTCYSLLQNAPNPFNTSTRIAFSLAEEREATLRVLNSVGQVVEVLVCGKVLSGNHIARWDGRDEAGNPVGSGVYAVQLVAGGVVQCKKMVLLR